ncbi:MAG TPA: hypothetical protein VGS23_08655 [Thermoplasmata archaeon]|nr:hypothetical protein [Thermoplasmata archaeon]
MGQQKYRMVRVREEDFQRMREAQRLLRDKGLDSIDWTALGEQEFVAPPSVGDSDEARRAALAAGFVIGVGAAALAALIAKRLSERSGAADE